MEKKEVIDKIRSSPHSKIKLAIADVDGILRGKLMHKDKFLAAADSGFGFCDVVFGWDAADQVYEGASGDGITGWHTGYPDALATIDLGTFRTVPWDNDMPFFLADFRNQESTSNKACPRTLLKSVIEKCEKMGFSPFFSEEFEWFNFEETPQSLEEKGYRNLKPMTPGMFGYSILRSSLKSEFFNELFDSMEKFNIPLEGLHTETGPGVYEAAIKYDTILESADRAVLFKTGVKEIANKHGLIATFMAKVNMQLPGCSGHVHQSLWNERRSVNLFHDDQEVNKMSKLMKSYIAGQLKCLPEILPMYAPNINSYKRLVEGAWAPTTLTWAVDNRTTALRAIPGSSTSSRLETRVVGADANPYLAMAACLASGLYGIENALTLQTPETTGNGYEDIKNGILPSDLNEATAQMKSSDLAKKLFGDQFVQHFTKTREWEWTQYAKQVTDWELKRYMEII
jgi:glutamine synthetase